MSPTVVDRPLVKSVNPRYSKRMLQYMGFDTVETVGYLHKVKGFDHYNHLLTVNQVFSALPMHDIVDRTNLALGPVRFSPVRSWSVPQTPLDLDTALSNRVRDICDTDQKINIMWSGGIDSTAIVVSFLKYAPDIQQCRILYSPWSIYEHPDFFELLQNYTNLELIDISGDFYLDMNLDGLFVSGNSGDEMHASLDESFFAAHGYDFLFTPWRDFFYSKIPNTDFIEFCQQHFSAAGRPIETVLEARWWFYAVCKLTGILHSTTLAFLTSDTVQFDPKRLIGFFDCDHYEQFVYFNLDRLVLNDNYATWKQFLKDFCWQFDGFDHWRVNKTKFHSVQAHIYCEKKLILNDARYIMLLDDGSRVSTHSLPLFSAIEWENNRSYYEYAFRHTDTVSCTVA